MDVKRLILSHVSSKIYVESCINVEVVEECVWSGLVKDIFGSHAWLDSEGVDRTANIHWASHHCSDLTAGFGCKYLQWKAKNLLVGRRECFSIVTVSFRVGNVPCYQPRRLVFTEWKSWFNPKHYFAYLGRILLINTLFLTQYFWLWEQWRCVWRIVWASLGLPTGSSTLSRYPKTAQLLYRNLLKKPM